MLRRIASLGVIAALVLGLLPSSAFAWCNGPALNGREGDGYGTHDWVLDRAISIAGSGASWVDRDVALLATDDPDTDRTNSAYHLFRDKGIGRGAPYKIGVLYEAAVKAYQNGDTRLASEYVGVMSHYYSDVMNPFHADYAAMSYDSLHAEYELDVDKYHRGPSNVTSWVTASTYKPVTNIRTKVISAAKYSRSKFPTLLSEYRASRSVGGTAEQEITRSVLSRASNDLADVIRTIPTGKGFAPAPTTMKMWLTRTYVAQNGNVGTYARCLDSNGNPMEGVAVKFTYYLKSGTKSVLAYTDTKGEAHHYQNVGASPLMKQTTVTASVTSAGTTKTASRWFMPTKRLADGRAGFRSDMSNHSPKRYTTVTSYAKAYDTSGRPVAGLPVTFAWKFKSGTKYYKAVTNSNGTAKYSRNIGGATKGYRVYVKATTQAGGSNRSSTTSFVPK